VESRLEPSLIGSPVTSSVLSFVCRGDPHRRFSFTHSDARNTNNDSTFHTLPEARHQRIVLEAVSAVPTPVCSSASHFHMPTTSPTTSNVQDLAALLTPRIHKRIGFEAVTCAENRMLLSFTHSHSHNSSNDLKCSRTGRPQIFKTWQLF
jgi:hypothetical protein